MSSDQDPPALLESANHLDWLPDETLYSLASRHHRLSGNVRPEQTAKQLFGHSRGGYPHDLPAGLDYFSSAFGQRLGSAIEIATNRTVLPLLLTFRDSADRRDALASMRSPRLGALKARLGLLASGFGAMCLLKACRTCMTMDSEQFGTAYWHLEHQLPGVWACFKHGGLLEFSISKRAGQGRFNWTLPGETDLSAGEMDERSFSADSSSVISRVASVISAAALTSRITGVPPPSTEQSLWSGLVKNGFATNRERLNRSAITEAYQHLWRQLSPLPDWTEPHISESQSYSRIRGVLGNPGRGHVLRSLTLVALLYPSWEEFLEGGKHNDPNRPPCPDGDDASVMINEARSKLIDLIENEGRSISFAARSTGIAVATAQSWLATMGIHPSRRPSRIRGQMRTSIVDQLQSGMSLSSISKLHEVSEVSVRRVLNTTPGLRSQWDAAKLARATADARTSWIEALQNAEFIGPGAARRLEPRAYAWLYRNDREWLMTANATADHPTKGNHASTNWDRRDLELSCACRKVALELNQESPGRRVSLIEIFKRLPELRTKLCHLKSLPLTAKELRIVTARTSTSSRGRF